MTEEREMSEVIASTYEVIREIGSGGGGVVYLANHLRLGKQVILKADKRKITTRPELLRREVDILKDLSHPHIPQVYDFFVEGETVYTVMDYIQGESLDKPLKRGEVYPQAQVIQWAIQLLSALHYLHSPTHGTPPRGFVHSDIKPANLMRTPDNEICLIDFNIALALGEENVIGCSAGYASPEHYGLDFSTDSETRTQPNMDAGGKETQPKSSISEETVRMPPTSGETALMSPIPGEAGRTMTMGRGTDSRTSKMKVVVPDVRSDIYSVGATLYHLLSGQRPRRNAREVVPLSSEAFSPQVVAVIAKAMNPNPDLRFQTAAEMLDAFSHLHERDPRMCRMKRNRIISSVVFSILFAFSVFTSFVGLKRMQTEEKWLKLAEYAQNMLAEGDTEAAVGYALQALPEETGLFIPEESAKAQKALTDALGVYDLADGYKTHETVELPGAPLYMALSPDGRTGCCMYTHALAVFDTDTAQMIATLPAAESALAEAEFLDNHTILYAGGEGLQAYDTEQDAVLWTGERATALCISGDGKRAAAVYRDEAFGVVYDTVTGQKLQVIDFGGRHQEVAVNDKFANPNDNLLALNEDGTLLGISFSDGALKIYSVGEPDREVVIFEGGSGYAHFEGGFHQQYFAFSAYEPGKGESVFAVIDTRDMSQTGGFSTTGLFQVQTDERGIYLQSDNLLVKIDPVTGEQTPLVTISEPIHSFARSTRHTLITSGQTCMFFDAHAQLISTHEKEYGGDFVQIAEGTALIANRDSPVIRVVAYENHEEAELFSYDPSYSHDEARVSGDGKTIMLFSFDQFRIYDIDGELIAEITIPDKEQVYDQQYIRDEKGSRLEVFYNDGMVRAYDGSNGALLYEERREKPDGTLAEEFFTDELRIESPLHGTPTAYNRKTGKLVGELEKDAYLTYVTQVGEYLVVQYVTAEGEYFGQLLDRKCQVLAQLPWLCDVVGERLIFDYPTGNLRESRIYDREELIAMGREWDE